MRNPRRFLVVFLFMILLAPFQLSYADYDTFTVNVPNAQGGYTAIVIRKSGDGYVGPQGEYYAQFPTVYTLQSVYGLGAAAPVNIPVSYVQPQVVQPEPVETQVIYQPAYQPVYQTPPPEGMPPGGPDEENNVSMIFQFGKKKKSNSPNQSNSHNQNTANAASPQANASAHPSNNWPKQSANAPQSTQGQSNGANKPAQKSADTKATPPCVPSQTVQCPPPKKP